MAAMPNEIASLFIDNSFPRKNITSDFGDLIQIPIISEPEPDPEPEPEPDFDAIMRSKSALIDSYECCICTQTVDQAFAPECRRTTCNEAWFCEHCLKMIFNSSIRYYGECVHCIRRISGLQDHLGNQVDMAELQQRCQVLFV